MNSMHFGFLKKRSHKNVAWDLMHHDNAVRSKAHGEYREMAKSDPSIVEEGNLDALARFLPDMIDFNFNSDSAMQKSEEMWDTLITLAKLRPEAFEGKPIMRATDNLVFMLNNKDEGINDLGNRILGKIKGTEISGSFASQLESMLKSQGAQANMPKLIEDIQTALKNLNA